MQVGNYKIELNQNFKEDTLLNLVYKYIVQLIADKCKEYMLAVNYDEVFLGNERIHNVIQAKKVYVLRMKEFRLAFFEKSVFTTFSVQLFEYILLLNGKTNRWYPDAESLETWLTEHITLCNLNQGYEKYLELEESMVFQENDLDKAAYTLASWIFPVALYVQDDDYFLENGQQIVGSSIDINQKYKQIKSFLNENISKVGTTIDAQTQNNPWFLVGGIVLFLFIGFIFVLFFLFVMR